MPHVAGEHHISRKNKYGKPDGHLPLPDYNTGYIVSGVQSGSITFGTIDGDVTIISPNDINLNPAGTVNINGGLVLKYDLIKDGDVQSLDIIHIPSLSAVSFATNEVLINGTGLGLSTESHEYAGNTINVNGDPTNYTITTYDYTSEQKINFTVLPDWSPLPNPTNSLQISDQAIDFYIKDEHYYVEFETDLINIIYLPNAEDYPGRSVIISYGKDRSVGKPLLISPSLGSNDTIDSCWTETEHFTLINPNERIVLTSSGFDNWVFT